MDIFVKQPGPLNLVNFTQPWSSNFANFDLFLDNFSNLLIFHNEGYFVIFEEFQHARNETKFPFTLNLASTTL